MKRLLFLLLALLMLSTCFLSACSSSLSELEESETKEQVSTTKDEKTEEDETEETKTEEKKETSTSDATEKVTEEKHQLDPSKDGVLKILLIGNSFATGWPDELNGLCTAAGVKVKVYSVYYAGCPVSYHAKWLKSGSSQYRLRWHKQNGGVSDEKPVNLKHCLKQENWDVISLQQHFEPSQAHDDYEAALKMTSPYANEIYDYLRTNFPKTKLVWHQTWAYKIGFVSSDKSESIPDAAYQKQCYENIRAVAHKVAEDNGAALIPCGDAWQYARANPIVGEDLTKPDGYHDGPEAGGQYMNACVWFESLTGKSCIGNTWRSSSYTLTEEKIAVLQESAHRAASENTKKLVLP